MPPKKSAAGRHASPSLPSPSELLPYSAPPAITSIAGLMSRKKAFIETNSDTVSVQFTRPSSSRIRKSSPNILQACAPTGKDLGSGRSPRLTPPTRSNGSDRPSSLSSSSLSLVNTRPYSPGWATTSIKLRHCAMSSRSPLINLPHHLSWLQNIYIDLWIDQEGFRAVYPTFKLVGYTKPELPPPQDIVTIGDLGTAEFMPLKRESFVFHHATLDAPPMMRRLSVNGDESRDFLSQHAHLSLKSSNGVGVYAVHGIEPKRAGQGDDDTGFDWKFEYTVEDKRKPGGEKVGHGEKILTPLRFSCSPGLVHPRQGRKVTVMQVWKKSVQPRVFAGKVELPRPPDTAIPSTSGHSSPSQGFSPKGIRKFSGGYKMAIWGISGSRRPRSAYGLLKENDSWEDISLEDVRQSEAKQSLTRRRSTSSLREGFEVLRSSATSMVSSRSRSMDARFVDVDGVPSLVQRQVVSADELERMLLMEDNQRRLSAEGYEGAHQWNLEEYCGTLDPPPFRRDERR